MTKSIINPKVTAYARFKDGEQLKLLEYYLVPDAKIIKQSKDKNDYGILEAIIAIGEEEYLYVDGFCECSYCSTFNILGHEYALWIEKNLKRIK